MGGLGSGKKKLPGTTLTEALRSLEGDIPGIIEQLKQLAYGKPVICPSCGAEVGINKIDREAAIYLIDRVLGKPKQVQEVDITHTIELSADQCEALIERARLAQQEVKMLTEGEHETDNSATS